MSKTICFLLTLVICSIFYSCNGEDGNPEKSFKITSIFEIKDGVSINRTSEILNCRIDDEYHFNDGDEIEILMGSEQCPSDPTQYVKGSWEQIYIDSLQLDVINLKLGPRSVILHDSFYLSQTWDQFQNEIAQSYKVLVKNNEEIILSTQKELSLPNTKNEWQIVFEKE